LIPDLNQPDPSMHDCSPLTIISIPGQFSLKGILLPCIIFQKTKQIQIKPINNSKMLLFRWM